MKKLISLLLCIGMLAGMVMAVPISAVRSEADAGKVGDANGDAEINAKDSIYIKSEIAKAEGIVCNKIGADVNGDGQINSRDSLLLKMYLAKAITSLFDGSDEYDINAIFVAGVDISEFIISVPSDATENMKYGADELSDYVAKACGVRLETVTDGTGDHVIYFAIDKTGELGTDGVDILVQNGNIYITGGTLRGCMYASYEFLERYVGWVFINEENEYINAAQVVRIADGSHYNHVPTITDRDSQTYSYGSYSNGTLRSCIMKLKISSWKNRGAIERSAKYGYGVGYVGTAHTIVEYTETVTSNSEQACFTDASVYQEVKTNVLAKIKSTLDRGYNCDRISVSPMDNTNYCQCRYCARAYREADSYMGPQLSFINKLSAEVAEIYPDTNILTTAYWNCRKPCQNMVAGPDVDIMFCWAGCNNHPFDGSECYEEGNYLWYNNIVERQFLEAWTQQCDCVYVWIYATSYCGMMAQPPVIDNIRSDIKFLSDLGVFGVYCEGYYGTSDTYKDGNCFDLLTMYMYARCMWDPDMSDEEFEEYVDEYLMYYYGNGWKYVREYMELWYESTDAVGKCWANNCDVPFDTMSFDYYTEHAEEMIGLIDKACDAAVTDEEVFNVSHIAASVYWLCLSATYETNYTNGTAAMRKVYEDRYTRLYNWVANLPIVNLDDKTDGFMGVLDFNVNPYAWVGFAFYHKDKVKNPLLVNF